MGNAVFSVLTVRLRYQKFKHSNSQKTGLTTCLVSEVRRVSQKASTALVPIGSVDGGGSRPGDSDHAGVIQAAPDKRQLNRTGTSRGGSGGHFWESSVSPSLIPGG